MGPWTVRSQSNCSRCLLFEPAPPESLLESRDMHILPVDYKFCLDVMDGQDGKPRVSGSATCTIIRALPL
jgi:hypothetical protein